MVDELYISKNRKYKNNCSSFEFVWALFFRHILKCVYYFRYFEVSVFMFVTKIIFSRL